jgi:hypothetical protein
MTLFIKRVRKTDRCESLVVRYGMQQNTETLSTLRKLRNASCIGNIE